MSQIDDHVANQMSYKEVSKIYDSFFTKDLIQIPELIDFKMDEEEESSDIESIDM